MVLSGKRDAEEKRLQAGKAQAVERTDRLHKPLDTCWADNEEPGSGGEVSLPSTVALVECSVSAKKKVACEVGGTVSMPPTRPVAGSSDPGGCDCGAR